jgi:hypothetical protein
LDFVFLESAFSLIPHAFLLVPPEHAQEKYFIYLEYMFVFATQFFDYVFNLSTNWNVAGVFKCFISQTQGKGVFLNTVFNNGLVILIQISAYC